MEQEIRDRSQIPKIPNIKTNIVISKEPTFKFVKFSNFMSSCPKILEIRRAHRVQIPKVQEFSRESDFFTERERETERVKQENRF